MSLSPGARLGPYEIQHALGAGGMGEVYKARDPRLDRSVAIKVLTPEFASDPQLRERFEREARTVAALDHPHICAIYDVGHVEGRHFLVMPCLEGQTLAARLAQGALPLDQALRLAREIADALDKAHRQGIVHRDLKPANIMLTKTGSKLLDFGLAKLRPPGGPISLSGIEHMATTTPGTAHGVILGTVQYMAPEQVEGREVDARTDVWAFGAVLYEMLTGTRPFLGETPASIIGSILKDVPGPVSARVPLAPPVLDQLVESCLAKDPEERWQSAADVGRQIAWIARAPRGAATSAAGTSRRWVAPAGWLMAVALAVALALVLTRARGDAPAALEPLTFNVYAPPGLVFTGSAASVPVPQFAVSPDGRHLVFVAAKSQDTPSLWLLSLRNRDAWQLPDTEHADVPFWSPDSQAIAFFARGVMKRRDLSATGPSEVLGQATVDMRGGSWSDEGTIVFAPSGNVGLFKRRVGAARVDALPFSDALGPFDTARWPDVLPGGESLLFQVRDGSRPDRKGIYVGRLDGTRSRRLVDSDFAAQYANGYVLYLNGTTLMAQRFDPETDDLIGEPATLAQLVAGASTGQRAFAASTTGVLAYTNGLASLTTLEWVERSGRAVSTIAAAADYTDFQLSPDNSRLAFSRTAGQAQAPDVWVLDLARGTESRITADALTESAPQWSPDGRSLVFRSNRASANLQLYRAPASAGAASELIWSTEQQQRTHGGLPNNVLSTDWSSDGKFIISHVAVGATGYDLWALPVDAALEPVAVAASRANEVQGRVSPDGRWIAYTSDESGRFETYVQAFPDARTAQKTTISRGGGLQPQWRADGRELFYLRSDGTLMAVAVQTGDTFRAGAETPLFKTLVDTAMNPYRMDYVPAADGKRFVMKAHVQDARPPSITVVLNWPALLGR